MIGRLLAIVALLVGSSIAAHRPQTDVDDLESRIALAEAAYRQGAWQEAARHYRVLSESLPGQRGRILFNLGNSEFRAGNLGQALLCYERARLRLPHDARVANNLARCRARLAVDEPAETPGVIGFLERRTRTTLVAIAVALQSLGIAIGLLGRRRRRVLRTAGAFIVLAGIAVAASVLHRTWTSGSTAALVTVAKCELRADPHESAVSILSLPTGAEIRVEEASDRWARVSHRRGTGWARCADIGVID